MPLSPRQAERLDTVLRAALVAGEVSAGKVRLWALVLVALNELLFLATHAELRGRSSAWIPSVVISAGAAVSFVHLRRLVARVARGRNVGASVGLDALLIFGVGATAALAPPPSYHGVLHHATTPFLLVAIAAAALRLSRSVVRLSILCNALGLCVLIGVDVLAGRMPTAEEVVLWGAAVAATGLVSHAAAGRARTLAIDAAMATPD